MCPAATPEFEELDEEFETLLGISTNNPSEKEALDEETLEILREEYQERINGQTQREKYYLTMGFKIARTSILLISILMSAIAIFLNQEMITASDFETPRILVGMISIGTSILMGTLSPFLISYIAQKKSEAVNRESAELFDDSTKPIAKRSVLRELVSQKISIANNKSKTIHRLQMISLTSLYMLLIGVSSIAWTLIHLV